MRTPRRPDAFLAGTAPTAAGVLRPRGVYVEPCEVPGKVVIVVHDSTREEIVRSRLSRRVATPATKLAFEAWLDAMDPPVRLCLAQ